ncbi:MAG: mechanosensitive ion channel family protein, partial [Bacillota bacterium]
GKIAGELDVVGVERLADSAVVLRARLQVVPPIEQWNVRREFLKRLKHAYARRGIDIPFPHLTIHRASPKNPPRAA